MSDNVYEIMGHDRRWYWRARDAHNRKIVAIGGEAYVSASNARRALRRRFGAGIDIVTVKHEPPRATPRTGTREAGRRVEFAAELVADLDLYDANPDPLDAVAFMYRRYGKSAMRLVNGAKPRPQQ